MKKSYEILMLLDNALAILDLATQEMADPKHTLHLTRIENEVIKGRASVVKGAELLKLKLEGRRVNE
jgi:hypothetical protein